MSNYEPNTPEKLPGIDKLSIKLEESIIPSSAYLPPPPSSSSSSSNNITASTTTSVSAVNNTNPTHYYTNNQIYHQHLSPPLTPAVSPSSVLLDSMQFKRKYSVDVGPFGFGTNIPHPSSMHDQDAYRRSSCSAVSMDCTQQQDYNNFLNVQEYTSPVIHQKPSRRGSRAQLSGPNTQHKHACKYPYCTWSFKRYEHLKRHLLVHTGKRPHSCHFPGCGKNFSRSDNFHAHYPGQQTAPVEAGVSSLLNHQVDDTNSFYPSDYNNNLMQPNNYYHAYPTTTTTTSNNDNSSIAAAVAVVAAAAQSSSSSSTCSRRSSSATPQHQKSHICPVSQCQRKFKRLEHLKRHMRIHTLERPFGCSFPNCHKTFSRSDNLSQHTKTHQRVEDRRRRQQRNDEPMKHLPPLQQPNQQQQQDTMMAGMTWHNTSAVGC
ncbi:hypothetical protein INT48_005521 [Thamnidium elegans]|uniref:C2H2-type domain-containing protein n=1 Tax=Thamnidium elegans TaxID=101142 RepID=A0A8H7W2G2_9FUNG|nr:hypothetical protein INT48_005521 [Thamnidium elegans]